MTSLIKRMAYDAAEPFERLGAEVFRKGALVFIGVSCLVVSLVFFTAALNDFLRAVAGPEIAAVSVGGVCLALVSDAVAPLGLDTSTQRAMLDRSAKLAERWTTLASLELRELVHSLVQQIQIGDAQISVWLNRIAIVSSVMPDAAPNPTDCMPAVEPLVLSISASLRRAGKGVRLLIGHGAAKRSTTALPL